MDIDDDTTAAGAADTVIRGRHVALPTSRVEDTIVPERDDPVPRGVVEDTVLRARPAAEQVRGVDDTVVRARSAPEVRGTATSATATGAGSMLPTLPTRAASPRVASVRIGDLVHRLDRPVVIGRKPQPSRIPTPGLPTPALVHVPSRTGQVSASHVAIRSEGGAVVVEDLRSTNGTVIRMPGANPQRLPAGASVVVLTGTVVEIGDGNVIEVLSPHLRQSVVPPIPTNPI